MKIGVCAKITPDADARIVVAADGNGIDLNGVKLGISDYDEYAIEEAIKTKEAHGGEVVSFTVGDKSADKQLRSGALALGVDRSVVVEAAPGDALGCAKLLAAAIAPEGCDVVFTGKSTIDDQSFQVGAMLAELLGWAHVSQVTALSFEGNTFKATRNMDAGVRQVVSGTLPAVITCEDGLNTVRYAKLPDIMKAKKKPLDVKSAGDLGADAGAARIAVGNMAPPPARPAGTMIGGDAATAAKELVRVLRDEAKVL
ncbi:MAG: electron transfer flavoprotein subunit beta/FixA family protein [Alphaproteobacteria bacterium]|nr:electron transfer flavoprotein subunit beta/FixA family protein [Alphaproteobacteria bacterium]